MFEVTFFYIVALQITCFKFKLLCKHAIKYAVNIHVINLLIYFYFYQKVNHSKAALRGITHENQNVQVCFKQIFTDFICYLPKIFFC